MLYTSTAIYTLNLNHVIKIGIVLKFNHVSCQHFMAECILDLLKEKYANTMIAPPMSVRRAEKFIFSTSVMIAVMKM